MPLAQMTTIFSEETNIAYWETFFNIDIQVATISNHTNIEIIEFIVSLFTPLHEANETENCNADVVTNTKVA